MDWDTTAMDFHWVDVFATGPLSGNPLVVATADAMPSAARMQALAAEFGVSETVFAEPGDPPRLRIFTPTAEIPMAGHPLVGTAWVLRRIGWIAGDGVLAAPGGEVAVAADDHGARMTRPHPVAQGHADAHALALLLGADAAGGAPIWHAGLPQAMLEVHDLDVLAPDHDGLRALGEEEGWAGVSAYVLRPSGADGPDRDEEGSPTAEVRHFAGPIGIPEDPVTGSAAAALGACLAARGTLGRGPHRRLTVMQGRGMGRPGRVDVVVDIGADGPTAVTVGGAVVPVATGAIGPGGLAG
jgi:trans-2,3-dihydro-3-hydroxyanthranilate isomerase